MACRTSAACLLPNWLLYVSALAFAASPVPLESLERLSLTMCLVCACVCMQLMENNSLQVNYVVQLKDYIGNDVQGRR